MSDAPAPGSVAASVPAAAAAEPVQYDPLSALQEVCKRANWSNGVKRGLHECAKALDANAARLCLLAQDCDEQGIVTLIKALCTESNCHLLMVPTKAQLGEWVGLCKIDSEGKPKNVVPTAVAVIVDFGEESAALQYLLDYLKNQ